jgi:hypothetical protein
VLAEISAAAAKAQAVLAKEALEKAGADAAAARVSENLTGAVKMIRRLLRKEHGDPATWKFGKGIVDQVMQVWGSRVKRKSLSARWALCKNDEDRPLGVGGGQYLLSPYEEVRLVAWVEALRSLNLAATMSDVVSKASDILECRGMTSTPSESWVRKLVGRLWPAVVDETKGYPYCHCGHRKGGKMFVCAWNSRGCRCCVVVPLLCGARLI